MALQNLLSKLRHKGLLGSSSAIRTSVNICGVGTSLCKPTPLQPWMPITQHFQTTLPDFAPLTRRPALRPGNSPSRRFLRTSRRFPRPLKIFQLAIKGKEVDRVLTKQASASVIGSLVCLSFLQDCETPVVFSGYVVRSDGIVATSTNCLRHLKGTEYKIGVKILGLTKTYEGVLLHADFLSKIAFVKILRCRQLRKPNCGKLDSLRKGADVVAMGCYPVCGSNWMNAKKGYSRGRISSVDDDVEKTVSHNARTSGKLIKVGCNVQKSFIGGAVVCLNGGVLGVIHTHGPQMEASPIGDVLKYLEYFEKYGYNTWFASNPLGYTTSKFICTTSIFIQLVGEHAKNTEGV